MYVSNNAATTYIQSGRPDRQHDCTARYFVGWGETRDLTQAVLCSPGLVGEYVDATALRVIAEEDPQALCARQPTHQVTLCICTRLGPAEVYVRYDAAPTCSYCLHEFGKTTSALEMPIILVGMSFEIIEEKSACPRSFGL